MIATIQQVKLEKFSVREYLKFFMENEPFLIYETHVGMAVSDIKGGAGFDYRYAMGVPDYWIKQIKETPDDFWPMGRLWHELSNRRHDEKTISYAESHDQALAGDQTLIFRLIGDRIYTHMSIFAEDLVVSRGISLHKMIRLETLATARNGYLNFMGNEFGHPEWIDFPREGSQMFSSEIPDPKTIKNEVT